MTHTRTDRSAWALAFIAALTFVSFSIVPPVLDALVRARFGDGGATAQFMGVHGVAALIFGLVGGFVADRAFGNLRTLGLALLGSGAATALLPQIDHFGLLLVVRFVDGACGSMALVLVLTRALRGAKREQRARNMAIVSTSIAAGFLAAPALVWLLLPIGLGALFAGVGAALIVTGMWVLVAPVPPSGTRRANPHGGWWQHLRRRKQAVVPIAFAFVDRYSFGTLAHLTSLILMDQWRKSAAWSSASLLLFWLAFLGMCFAAGRSCRRHGSMATLLWGSALYGVSLVLLGLGSLSLFFVAMVLAGGFCALQYVPSMALVGDCIAEEHRGAVMGLWHLSGSIGMVLGLSLSGVLSQISYALAYGVAGALEVGLVCATVLIHQLGHRWPQPARAD